MSTKIYNFYHYLGGDIYDLWRELLEIRQKTKDYTLESLSQLNGQDLFAIEKLLREETRKGFNSPFNVEASAVIYLHQDKLFVQFFGVPEDLYQDKAFADFHYQDQTDRPEGISDEEWEVRRSVTESIFQDGRPSYDGLVFNILTEDDTFSFASELHRRAKKDSEDTRGEAQ